MQEILVRAGCFIAIIILGYSLKKFGFFKEEDFKILSKIVIKITLPASIIFSFSGKVVDPSMLTLAALGLGCGLIYVVLAWLINKRRGKERQAFEMLNTAGYNIGNFTMPFVQSFLGPTGVITTSLFDTGNAFICLGGAYSAASIVKDGGRFSVKRIVRSLVKSIPFDCYIIMTALSLMHISLPAPVVSFAEIIANANAFMAMLMIGVGFKLSSNKEQIGSILRILTVRYGMAVLFALGFYYLLPFSLEIRQTLMILAFGPIASAAPAFTGEMKSDVGLSSAVNSLSIIISIVCIVSILLITR
ncbi:MAG: AEC family transporter [Lachnospiraceae bacterium]|nr:AEC family transporter [Lachnospiraceae bacterium]